MLLRLKSQRKRGWQVGTWTQINWQPNECGAIERIRERKSERVGWSEIKRKGQRGEGWRTTGARRTEWGKQKGKEEEEDIR